MAATRVSSEISEVLIGGGTTTARVSSAISEVLYEAPGVTAHISTALSEVLMSIDDVPVVVGGWAGFLGA